MTKGLKKREYAGQHLRRDRSPHMEGLWTASVIINFYSNEIQEMLEAFHDDKQFRGQCDPDQVRSFQKRIETSIKQFWLSLSELNKLIKAGKV